MAHASRYDHVVVNDDLSRDIAEVRSILGLRPARPSCRFGRSRPTWDGRRVRAPGDPVGARSLSPVPEGALVRVLVTAGPTREPIDAVRYLSNRSSGKLGYAVAAAARAAGHTVTLVSGPTCVRPPRGVRLARVTTAREMRTAVQRAFRAADAVIMCAAVADWRPARVIRGKLRRERARSPMLRLVPNPDILAELGRRKGRRLLVGFALEAAFGARGPRTGRSDPAVASAIEKLRRKNLDWIVLNGPQTLEGDRATAVAIARDGRVVSWKELPKARLARALVRLVLGR